MSEEKHSYYPLINFHFFFLMYYEVNLMVVPYLDPTIILIEPVHKCHHELVLGCKYRGRHLAALSLSHRHLKCGFTRQDYQPYVWVLCIIYIEYQWIYYDLDLVDVVRGWANVLLLLQVSRGAESLGMDRKWAKVAYSHALGQCVTCWLVDSTADLEGVDGQGELRKP